MHVLAKRAVTWCALVAVGAAPTAQEFGAWAGQRVIVKSGTPLRLGRQVVEEPLKADRGSPGKRPLCRFYQVERVQGVLEHEAKAPSMRSRTRRGAGPGGRSWRAKGEAEKAAADLEKAAGLDAPQFDAGRAAGHDDDFARDAAAHLATAAAEMRAALQSVRDGVVSGFASRSKRDPSIVPTTAGSAAEEPASSADGDRRSSPGPIRGSRPGLNGLPARSTRPVSPAR
jgi:hypothetical protein